MRHLETNPDQKLQTFQMVGQGGDKYCLTLITFQVVVNWYNAREWPEGQMPRFILVVPCSQHARLENIDQNGRWVETVLGIYYICIQELTKPPWRFSHRPDFPSEEVY